MTSRSSGPRGRLIVEAVAAGLAYAMTLWWLSVCALASFRPDLLSFPYWPHLAGLGAQQPQLTGLRSDTSGALAFLVAAVCIVVSEYLRLRRKVNLPAPAGRRWPDSAPALLAVAVAEMVVVLATGLVVYISTNAITHPDTLLVGTSHLAPWPAEGTLRILALIGCVASVAVLRYLLARSAIGRAAATTAVPPGERSSAGNGHHEPTGEHSFGALLPPIADGQRIASGDGRLASRVSPAAGSQTPAE
jgi:hypothetical protein